MHCSDFAEWIARKLDGTLPERQLDMLHEHLSGCSRCRAELFLQRQMHEALSEEVYSGLSVDFTEMVTGKVVEMARRERRARVWLDLAPVFALGAAAVVVFLVGADLVRVLPSPVHPMANVLFKPVVWALELVSGLLGGLADFSREHIGGLGRLSGPLANTLLVTILGSLPAIWGFHRIVAFLRE